MFPDIAFDVNLDHGRCVGIRLPEADASIVALAETALVSEERAFAGSLTAIRRRTWVGGRAAMRQALARVSIEAPPVLADARGAPILPAGIAGSISHKENLAVALVARDDAHLGVDVELDHARARNIASKVLTDEEVVELAGLVEDVHAHEVLLRFSAKEAIYKAIDPFVRRYVGFKEVTVKPLRGGYADVWLHLSSGEGPFVIDVRWLRWQRFVLTTARVERR
ncbi:MAG: 4'-phosphopantetheinyl transferase superfamily protein [Myxococcota bacterium]|nr:4'-phosphopantetheinyl transferase superfamily protein [Myxococcota bacterium]